MKKISLIFTSILVLGLTAGTAFAQGGEDALPFLRIDRNPVSSAMAGAGSASTSGIAYSAFRNASVIPFFEKNVDLGLSVQGWAPKGTKSTNLNFGAGWKITPSVGVALSFANQWGQKYDVYNYRGVKTGTFTPKDMIIGAGAGVKLAENIGLGANIRYARQTLAQGISYSSVGGDVLLYYRPMDCLGLTAGARSFGSGVEDSAGNKFDIPASAHAAGEYSVKFGNSAVRTDLDLDYYFSGNFCGALGVEYGINDTFFARAGYHLGADEAVLPSYASVGAGVKIPGVRFDFAYLTANDFIGNSFTIGFSVSF